MNIYGNKVVNIDARLGLGSSFKHASRVSATFTPSQGHDCSVLQGTMHMHIHTLGQFIPIHIEA